MGSRDWNKDSLGMTQQPKVETSVQGQTTDKQTVAHPHDGVGGNSDTHYSMDGPQGHHAE